MALYVERSPVPFCPSCRGVTYGPHRAVGHVNSYWSCMSCGHAIWARAEQEPRGRVDAIPARTYDCLGCSGEIEAVKPSPTIRLRGLDKWGKERVARHGDEFLLMRRDMFRGHPAVLVRSVSPAYADGTRWRGWFQLGINAEEVE